MSNSSAKYNKQSSCDTFKHYATFDEGRTLHYHTFNDNECPTNLSIITSSSESHNPGGLRKQFIRVMLCSVLKLAYIQ